MGRYVAKERSVRLGLRKKRPGMRQKRWEGVDVAMLAMDACASSRALSKSLVVHIYCISANPEES